MPAPNSTSDAEVEIPIELQHRIDVMHERVGVLDYYAILSLPRSVTRTQVRQAFLAQAPQFHPDKYRGKKLGPYGAKMDRVFSNLSAAHDTLVDDDRRAAYTRGLAPEGPLPQPLDQAVAARIAAKRPPPVQTRTSDVSAAAARARQQAILAARLGGPKRIQTPPRGTAIVPSAAPAITTPSAAETSKAAVEALRRRYEETVASSRGRQTHGLVQAADAAAAKGDFVEAARLYRTATEHSSDPNLKAVLGDTEVKAKMQVHTQSSERAKQAEERQEFQEAGLSWARAYEAMPSAETAHRASLCLRRAGTDLRRAAKYGEEAVKTTPNRAAYRINLALVYVELGLSLRAHGEIERAQALEPTNPQLKEAIARVKAMK